MADPENLKIFKTNRFFFSFLRRFTRKSKNYQHTTVPDGGARGTRLALRGRRDIEKNCPKTPYTFIVCDTQHQSSGAPDFQACEHTGHSRVDRMHAYASESQLRDIGRLALHEHR